VNTVPDTKFDVREFFFRCKFVEKVLLQLHTFTTQVDASFSVKNNFYNNYKIVEIFKNNLDFLKF